MCHLAVGQDLQAREVRYRAVFHQECLRMRFHRGMDGGNQVPFVLRMGHDVHRTSRSQEHASEVNPRFGGGYPHVFESGCDHMTMILNNLQGRVNAPCIGIYDDGIYMMKYNEKS